MSAKRKSARRQALATSLRIEGNTASLLAAAEALLATRTSRQLAVDLRTRGLPIPRDKRAMVSRLLDHLIADNAALTLTIG